jgi:6-phosphogluconolactonase
VNLRIFESLPDLVRAATRTVLERAVDGSAIALSGGSTPEPLYAALGASDELRERAVTWSLVDERCVPPGHPQSNAAMIERTLFARGVPAGQRFVRFHTELDDPARTAEEYQREWQELAIGDLDLIVLGVGEDGHTASLFPGTDALEPTDRIATAVFVPRLAVWRVTLTLPVIRAAKLRIVLAAGESKRAIIGELRAGADYPIARATAGEGETWWFVDRAAAG